MPSRIKGIIFDLDGTLIDSREDLVGSVNHTLGIFGIAALPGNVISGYVGDGVKNLLTRCLAHSGRGDLLEKAIPVFKDHYREHLLDKTRLYPGVPEVLEFLQGRNLALITNKPQEFTMKILGGLGIARFFDPVLGGDSPSAKKPDPQPVLHVLHLWDMKPSDALMVGDSANDMEAGKKAGTRTCAVTYGFRPREELERCGADRILDSFFDLKELVC